MSKVKYIKVLTADRLPEKSGIYMVDGFKFAFFNGIEFLRFNEVAQVEWWLLEVPDKEEEMREMLEGILNDLNEDPEDFPTSFWQMKLNDYLTN